MNVATGGFGTELTVKTDEDLKNKMGGAAYLFTGVFLFNTMLPCDSSRHMCSRL